MWVFSRKGPSGVSVTSTAEQDTVGTDGGFSGQSSLDLRQLLEQKMKEYPKCEKCSRVFCSPVNFRRHVRVHRGSLNVDKESHKIRGLLAAFWDKLSLERVKEILAFDDVMLKEIPGSSLLNCLASSLRKSGASTLPQVYLKAGSSLLDIIQAKPSRLPISSQELFSILDDASERTFLCAGTAESLQNYVFGRETTSIDLGLKNLVASTSFLFEQQLVKAWVADKDAETLRCQKLLVEEEEAAQKRQAVLLERKTQKKLRRKEQKVKEQFYGDNADRPTSAEASQPSRPSASSSHAPFLPTNLDSLLESLQLQRKEADEDIEAQFDSIREPVNQWDCQTIEHPTPLKVWKQKCTKCSWEFCSPINYKRHIRMHHRSFNIDKVSHKNRNLLAAFWDKLSLQQVKEILAFDDVMLKEIPAPSIINCLASSLHKLGVSTLPEVYVKAGFTLLDIIQAKPSRFPISSHELFSILDDASERTFLCAGTAESLQKYVFDGDTATISDDLKNLVASTSFLFEQQLVKAWTADKDAEALRCQKLKQEEAAQKRQAMFLERKTRKKLLAKEKKVKEKFCGGNADSTVNIVAADTPTSAEASKPSPPPDSSSKKPVWSTNLDSPIESLQPPKKEPNEDIEPQFDSSSEPVNQGDSQTIKHPGSPLLSPLKVHTHKCEKCSQSFYSPINYRRHVQVHHRSLIVDKESHKNRDLLAAFWDKLSFEQVKEILTFDDAMLKDIIQAKPSGPPISSQQLFSILDDVSERTFLCGGAAESLQKYVFDEETAKNSLDLKNLVATFGFLFEQQLLKAWIADKDAEALRSQKLLVEKEESEQKRQAVVLESKKQKKLCQNEPEVKEQLFVGNTDSAVVIVAARPTSAKALELSTPSDSSSNAPYLPKNLGSCLESLQLQRKESDKDIKARFGSNRERVNNGDSHTIEPQVAPRPSSSRGETSNQISDHKRVMTIGSKPLTLGSHVAQQPPDEAVDTCSSEPGMLNMKTASEKEIKANTISHGETKSIPPVDRENEDSEQDAMLEKVHDQLLPGERSTESQPTDDEDFDNRENYSAPSDENAEYEVCPHYSEDYHVPSDEYAQREFCPYCIAATREFFAKRWEAAISEEHEILDLS